MRRSSSRSPRHEHGLVRQPGLDRDAPLLRQGRQCFDHLGRDGAKIDRLRGREVGAHLDARQRQEVVDQALHALRLPPHDVEEPLPRLGIVAGRALQGLDEAQHGGQRRAQLVARIGDEIGAHGLETPGRGEVAEEQDDPGLDIGMAGRIGLQRADMDLEGPLGRDPLRILDPQGLPRVEHLLDAVEHIRAAQGEGQGMPCLQAGQERVGGLVGLEHHRPRVDQDDGIRDMGQNRLGDARSAETASAAA